MQLTIYVTEGDRPLVEEAKRSHPSLSGLLMTLLRQHMEGLAEEAVADPHRLIRMIGTLSQKVDSIATGLADCQRRLVALEMKGSKV